MGATDAMDACDKRAIGIMSLSTCIVHYSVSLFGDVQGKGKGRRGDVGEGDPANRTWDYKPNAISKRDAVHGTGSS